MTGRELMDRALILRRTGGIEAALAFGAEHGVPAALLAPAIIGGFNARKHGLGSTPGWNRPPRKR